MPNIHYGSAADLVWQATLQGQSLTFDQAIGGGGPGGILPHVVIYRFQSGAVPKYVTVIGDSLDVDTNTGEIRSGIVYRINVSAESYFPGEEIFTVTELNVPAADVSDALFALSSGNSDPLQNIFDNNGGLEDITKSTDDYYGWIAHNLAGLKETFHNTSAQFSNNNLLPYLARPQQYGQYSYELLYFNTTDTGTDLMSVGPLHDMPTAIGTYSGTRGRQPRDITGLDVGTFFNADASGGREPHETDGTAAGTARFFDVRTGSQSSNPAEFTRVGDKIYFWGDGDGGVRVRVADLAGTAVTGLGVNTMFQYPIVPFDGGVAWTVSNGAAVSVFRADEAGTVTKITDVGPTAGPIHNPLVTNFVKGLTDTVQTALNSLLMFKHDIATGWELHISDGTEAGTELITDLNPGSADSKPTEFLFPGMAVAYLNATNHKAFLAGETDSTGTELLVTDGTAAGTQLIEIAAGAVSSSPFWITTVGDVVMFFANDGVNGVQLWKSDGTQAGTQLVKVINPGGNAINPSSVTTNQTPVVVNGILYFVANDGSGPVLWASDGTEQNTQPVLWFPPSAPSPEPIFSPVNLVSQNGALVVENSFAGGAIYTITTEREPVPGSSISGIRFSVNEVDKDVYTPGGVALQPVTELPFVSKTTGDADVAIVFSKVIQRWDSKTDPNNNEYTFVGNVEVAPGLGGPEMIFKSNDDGRIIAFGKDAGWLIGSGELKAEDGSVDFDLKALGFFDDNPFADFVTQDNVSNDVVIRKTMGIDGQQLQGSWEEYNAVPLKLTENGIDYDFQVLDCGDFFGYGTDQLLVEEMFSDEKYCYDGTLPGATGWTAIPGAATLDYCATASRARTVRN